MSQDAKSRKPKGARTAKSRGGPERLKCSLLLTKDNDLRLTVLASLRGTDRSTLLNSILDDALRGVVVSLRGALAIESSSSEPSGAGEGVTPEADPEAA